MLHENNPEMLADTRQFVFHKSFSEAHCLNHLYTMQNMICIDSAAVVQA